MEISVNSATCFKNNNTIFSDMNISLKKGEIAMITGPNGSGKTTLIRSLSGIQNLESGNILINNKDISDHNSNFTEKKSYKKIIYEGEIKFTNVIYNMGYILVESPVKLFNPAYDIMRGIEKPWKPKKFVAAVWMFKKKSRTFIYNLLLFMKLYNLYKFIKNKII